MTAAYYDDPAFLYGNTSRLYDEVPSTFDSNRLQWRFEVAWLSNFVYFSEANGQTEAVYAFDCSWSRGRPTFVNYDGNGLTNIPPGRMVVTLVNPSKRYDPNNTTSPLFPNVVPGKLARLGVRKFSSSTYTWRFSGIVEDVRAYRTPDGEEYAEITIVDGWKWLQDRTIYIPASSGVNASTHVAEILSRAEWPDIWGYTITADANTTPWFWAAGKDARVVLHDLANTQGSRVWITGDGKVHYEPATPVSGSTVTFSQSDLLKIIDANNPWQNSWNVGVFEYRVPYNYNVTEQVWGGLVSDGSLFEYTMATGDTLIIEGRYDLYTSSNVTNIDAYSFLVAFAQTVSDVLYSPYPLMIWRSASGGGGSDVSGYIEILDFEDGGDGFRLTLKNNYSGTVYLRSSSVFTYLRMVRKDTQKFTLDNSGTGTKKPIFFSTPYMLLSGAFTIPVTKTMASNQMDWINATRQYPTFTLDSKPDKQFFDVFGIFFLSVSYLNIGLTMRCGILVERWRSPNAQAVETSITGEPAEF